MSATNKATVVINSVPVDAFDNRLFVMIEASQWDRLRSFLKGELTTKQYARLKDLGIKITAAELQRDEGQEGQEGQQ